MYLVPFLRYSASNNGMTLKFQSSTCHVHLLTKFEIAVILVGGPTDGQSHTPHPKTVPVCWF